MKCNSKKRPTSRSIAVGGALVLSLLLSSVGQLNAGADEEIRRRQMELQKIRTEIEQFEQRIKENDKREAAALEQLDNFDRQATLLKKLVVSLREAETKLQREIQSTRKDIGELSAQVKHLKEHYANYVRATYKYGRSYDLELLLSSKSINQLYIRSQYLQRFSQQRQTDLVKLENRRATLASQTTILQAQLEKERQLIAEKTREEARLRSRMDARKKLLVDIRKNKKNFQREVDRKRQAEKDLQQLIARLVEQEQIRKEREATLAREGKPVTPDAVASGAFESMRGKLPWPVPYGRIAARFGNQVHPVLRTVTENTGIDISVPLGTEVLAVADGEVSTVWWLPSFGNLVILNHNDGFRTVYAHLSEIEVAEGEKVRGGIRIGRSGESLSGPMVHFEVWKYRDKQDPELWLRPQGLTQR